MGPTPHGLDLQGATPGPPARRCGMLGAMDRPFAHAWLTVGGLLAATALATGGEPGPSRGSKRPNILCITCEDISPMLASYGDPTARTPFLDALARDGVRFARMFSVSGVCAPSRAALITGMYPTAIGADNMRTFGTGMAGIEPYEAVPPSAVRPFTEYLRAAGYYTTNRAKTDYQFRAPLTAWDESGPQAHWRNRPPGTPFFAVFNLEVTHESQVWARAGEPLTVDPLRVVLPRYYPDTPVVRRDVARVYSNIEAMDRQAAALVEEVERAGLGGETIVVFFSDNGGPLPRGKREVLDSGLHVPFVIRFPGRDHAGTVVEDLVSFVDVPATILSLAGVPVPGHVQGRPFWGAQKAPARELVFAARDRMDEKTDSVRAARDRRYAYVRNYRPDLPWYQDLAYRRQMPLMQELLRLRDEGRLDPVQRLWFRETKPREELYDTTADPHEVHDVAADPAFAPQLERLRAALDAWIHENGDRPGRPERELREEMWPGGAQPVTAAPTIAWRDGRVTIEAPTAGAATAYQVDGRGLRPDHWLLYGGPFAARSGAVVTAVAHRLGYAPSAAARFVVP